MIVDKLHNKYEDRDLIELAREITDRTAFSNASHIRLQICGGCLV